MSTDRKGVDALDALGLLAADRAFLDTRAQGTTTARCVHAAIAAYVEHVERVASRQAGAQRVLDALVQHVASIPDDHPDLAGGQVLVRSFDGGNSWEVCTRPDHYATWSVGVQAVSA